MTNQETLEIPEVLEVAAGAEEIAAANTVETPIEIVVPAAPVEHRFEYQPTDEQGRPIGGKQVVLYRNPEELSAKLVEQNTLLLRKLRAETRKNRLGIPDEETLGEDAPRFAQPASFKPKELTADQKVALAMKLGVDPEDFDAATDELFEAKFGVKPSDMASKLQLLEDRFATQDALTEVEAFKKRNPDFVICQENSSAITSWLARYKLAPVCSNFQRAYDTLRAAGILIENVPAVAETVIEPVEFVEPVIETVQEEIPPTPEPVEFVEPASPKPVSRVPVSLSRNNTEETGGAPTAVGSDIVYDVIQNGQKRRFTGLAAINAMPAEEYRKRTLSDPSFSKKEAALEKEAAQRRQRRG